MFFICGRVGTWKNFVQNSDSVLNNCNVPPIKVELHWTTPNSAWIWILRDRTRLQSCQIVQPLAPDQIPVEAKENNYGLSNPGNIQAYLQVVDLMADKLRYASISLINMNIFILFYNTWAWHYHGSGTSTSPRAIVLYTVFPHIVAAATILFWKLECGKYSREEIINLLLFCKHS